MAAPTSSNHADATLFPQWTRRGQWLGWSPKMVGLVTGLLFALPSLAVIWNMHVRAGQLLEQAMRNRLLAAAQSVANEVDAEVHGSFQSREQEATALYQAEIGKLARMKAALDVEGMVRFVYTCVGRDGGCGWCWIPRRRGMRMATGRRTKRTSCSAMMRPVRR